MDFRQSTRALTSEEIENELCQSSEEDKNDEISSGEEVVLDEADQRSFISDSGESVEFETEQESFDDQYRSKDGKLIWYTKKKNFQGRQPRENIMKTSPGVTRYAITRVNDIKSSFDLFFSTELVKIILQNSNLEGNRVFSTLWKTLDEEGLEAYLGLCVLAGVYRSHGEAVENLWHDHNGRPIFRMTMSLKRFKQITRVIRFDDKATRKQRRERDKLAPIRTFWDKWEVNLQKYYNPHDNVTIDEQLVPFHGRCPFRQYIPSKPAKYGIKIWALCCSKTNYAWKLQVYTGKPPNCRPEINQGKRVVLELTKDLIGRNVVCDNFFTSFDLAVDLKKRCLTIVGTVRKNKTFLPPKILDIKGQPQFSSKFFYEYDNDVTLVSYKPTNKNKIVILLSSFHHDDAICQNQEKKPIIIMDYNKNKSGVDTLDQLVATYTSKRKTNRWPMALFGNILDISAYNAFVIFREIEPAWNAGKKFKRRLFLEELGQILTKPEILRRKAIPRGPNSTKTFQDFCKANSENLPMASTSNLLRAKRGRCFLCQSSKDSKYSDKCSTCNKFVCSIHKNKTTLCINCSK